MLKIIHNCEDENCKALKDFVESIAWWMQGDQVYNVKAEVDVKVKEARQLLDTLRGCYQAPMYCYESEMPSVFDCWKTATDFIEDMKLQHPEVSFTHIGVNKFLQMSLSASKLYASILQEAGDDEETALRTFHNSVTVNKLYIS